MARPAAVQKAAHRRRPGRKRTRADLVLVGLVIGTGLLLSIVVLQLI